MSPENVLLLVLVGIAIAAEPVGRLTWRLHRAWRESR